MTTSAQLRLLSDLKAIEVEPPEGCSASPLSEDNLFVWGASILGPVETPWEGGIFQLRVTFSEHYPDKPPRVRFVSECFHPNVYSDGTLCLDIIQDSWSPCHNICSILTSIQSLLTDPNCASPANPEAAQLYTTNRKEFNRKVRRIAQKSVEIPAARRLRRAAVVAAAAGGGGGSGIKLAGVGSSVPEKFLTNDDLAQLVDTSDEWIISRTGIKKRHILSEGESLGSHAAAASRRALEMAGVAAEEVELVIMATSSPDDLFGSATTVQAAIGATGAAAFDLTAACSGFVMGLVTGAQYIKAGTYKTVLVIGADALSRYIDWRDRGTCILFGDGCGAVVLRAQEGSCGLLGIDMHSDGNGMRHLNCAFAGEPMKPLSSGDASKQGAYNNLHMNGQEVFKFAVRAVPTVIEAALADAGMEKQQIDWLVMHQANMRIMSSAADRLGVPPERVVSNLSQYGNTSAASIPLALDEAVRRGDIKPGEVLAMAGFGAGLSWASAIVRWG
ncbi:3-oxoacyl-ACP synthase [Micractinium conductrix]|uniref:beta-ketoacyl-[acyl-carrier-protein] synthase III n=1 Tax=Micractinium conductrix TaxID=554055 RepID=A0A2P6VKN6_9CHLO|nr:3-oxoacyl-ACP synthase [Micractinium conductrix]|eukprot:PSC74644.1 3-oxoacyl-ACP synthase [Micractinium conductrix]